MKTYRFAFLDPILYRKAVAAFKSIHYERFYARIDWSAGAEILAIVLIFTAQISSLILASARIN